MSFNLSRISVLHVQQRVRTCAFIRSMPPLFSIQRGHSATMSAVVSMFGKIGRPWGGMLEC